VTQIDSETKPKSKLLFPGLESFYAIAVPLAWPIVRIAVGWNFGARLGQGHARAFGLYPWLRRAGIRPCAPLDLGRVDHRIRRRHRTHLGLFTRFFAAAAAVEMLVITVLYWKAGFSLLNRGYEYTLLWGLICFAIALRGGGPYSLDRRIGIEL